MGGEKVAVFFSSPWAKCANFRNEILRGKFALGGIGFGTLDAVCECTFEF